jgi:hypothetical protein
MKVWGWPSTDSTHGHTQVEMEIGRPGPDIGPGPWPQDQF